MTLRRIKTGIVKWYRKNSGPISTPETLYAGRANSKPLLGATFAPSLPPCVLEKIFSLEMVKNDLCLGGASKQNALF